MSNLVGATTAVFPVRLSVASNEIVNVEWTTSDGTALSGLDYKAAKGVVKFLPGETEKQIQALVYGQPIVPAADKVFYIRLSPPSNAILVDSLLTCKIVVDDLVDPPATSIIVAEGRRGPKGETGRSAYEQAVYMGLFTGTVEQWMQQIADASSAADRAENAAVAANIGSKVYATPQAGVNINTGVPAGDYFNVRSLSSNHYVDEYQNVAGVATATGKSYPNIGWVERNAAIAEAAAISATISSGIYQTPSAGVAPVTGVPVGDYFNVRSVNSEHYVDEYQNVAGVATATGKSYPSSLAVDLTKQQILDVSDRVGNTWRNKVGGYGLNDRVMLENGGIVKSTVSNNTANPNVNMTGWVGIGNTITVNSIADLITIGNLRNGTRAYIKSYHAGLNSGGGYFTYENSRAAENDGGVVINGWVREVNNVAIMPAWFGVRTDGIDDPLNPNHELLQAAIDAGFKSFDFGGANNRYLFNGQVGLISQGFYSTNAYRFSASGALVTLKGARSWITNIKVKNNGGVRGIGTDFTGKLLIHGFSFTGRNSEGVFDGDNIYNVIFSNNDCYRMDIISKSYAGRHPTYAEGYFQSVYLLNNHFSATKKILDGKRGFNITVSDNTFESCAAGIYIFGSGEPAISTIRIKDNAFEGGGVFLKLGDAMAGTISGNYTESNDQGDTITEKCSIIIDRSGGSYLANYTIENNMFSASIGQLSDPDYQNIKIVGYPPSNLRGIYIRGNWSSSVLTKSPVRNMYQNTAKGTSKGTGTAINSFVDFNVARKSLSVSSNVSAGVLDVFWIDTVPNSNERVDNQLTVKLSCTGSTAGGIELTRFFLSFDFAIYSILVGSGASRMPLNTGVAVSNLSVMQQPESQIIDTVLSVGQKPMLISPTISVASIGDRHIFKLSGFTATASSNYGGITNLDVYAEITSFGSRSYASINNLISYYK